jgi:hypothetical protein
MSTKRSKPSTRSATDKFASKNRRTRRRLGLEIGDRIQVIDIPPYLKDPNYDLVDSEHREMRTGELFRFCLGRKLTIRDFGKYGTVELDAGANREVRKKFGKWHTIWVEPEQVRIVRKKRRTQRTS